MADVGDCRSCQKPMLWVMVAGEGRRPLDVEERPPAPGLVAVNPARATAVAITAENLEMVRKAVQRGATCHFRHHATCMFADRHAVPRAQEGLF